MTAKRDWFDLLLALVSTWLSWGGIHLWRARDRA